MAKPSYSVSEYGKDLAYYSTMKEASKATGAPADNIKLVCVEKRKRAGGYRWRFADEERCDNWKLDDEGYVVVEFVNIQK